LVDGVEIEDWEGEQVVVVFADLVEVATVVVV
jgi:hypothetical protein